jgi:hypothetical protein
LFFGSTTVDLTWEHPVHQVKLIGRGRSFTCTPLGLNSRPFLFFGRYQGSQNGLYQWPITLGDVVHPFDIVKKLGTWGWALIHAEKYGNQSVSCLPTIHLSWLVFFLRILWCS